MCRVFCFTPLLLLTYFGVASANADVVSPFEWKVADGGNGHFYELVFTPGGETITWEDAKDGAAQRVFNGINGHLVTITEEAEDDFIESMFRVPLQESSFYAWIGLSDAATEDTFEWVTGEPFSYTNWLPGEPNNLLNEDYVHYFAEDPNSGPRWGWNDTFNDVVNTRAYFVEYDPSSIPEPSSIIFVLAGLFIAWSQPYRKRSRLSLQH